MYDCNNLDPNRKDDPTMSGPHNDMSLRRVAECRMRKRTIYLGASILTVVMILLSLGLTHLYGNQAEARTRDYFLAFFMFMPVVFVHECIHAVAAITWGKIRKQDLRIGMQWKVLAASCHIRVPVTVYAARRIVLAPLVVTVPIAYGVLMCWPSNTMAILAALTFSGCLADMVMLNKLRVYDSEHLFLDRSSELGFDIYEAKRTEDIDPLS